MECIRITVCQAEEAQRLLAEPGFLDKLIAEQEPKWEIGDCSLEVTSGLEVE